MQYTEKDEKEAGSGEVAVLENCPCCGEKARFGKAVDFHYVQCTSCSLTSTLDDNQAFVAMVWNTRTLSSELEAAKRELAEAKDKQAQIIEAARHFHNPPNPAMCDCSLCRLIESE